MGLIRFLSEWLVWAHCDVLFLFRSTCWLISIVAAHWSISLRSRLFSLRLHALAKGPSDGASISIVNHWFSVGLARHAKLVLVPAVSTVLRQNRIFQILVLGNRTHEVVVLRNYALVWGSLSLLLGELRLALVVIVSVLRFHVLANYFVFGQLLLRHLLLLVPIKSRLVRV